MLKFCGLFMALFFAGFSAQAKHNGDHPLSPEDWKEVMEKVVLLEDSGLMPTLLPIIMSNRDALQLTEGQISSFRAWRKKNYTNVVNLMNEILEKKVQFRSEALSPDTSDDHLFALQVQIQEMQRRLLKLKLSCRKLIMTTFTDDQWENFSFVVADNPRLASLLSLSQASMLDQDHSH